jgi:hypothetical protein
MYNVVVEWLDEGKSRARFSLPGRSEWSAQHVSDLIRILADIREEMTPAVSEAPPPVHEPLHDPRYATELHPFSGGTLLELRHPSLGWLEFVLPSLERKRISSSLAEQESAWQRHGTRRGAL